MRVCIHRGTKQIGGTCIEVEAQGKRIVLDVGLPLDADETVSIESLLPPVPGFREADDSLLGAVIQATKQHGISPQQSLNYVKCPQTLERQITLFSESGDSKCGGCICF